MNNQTFIFALSVSAALLLGCNRVAPEVRSLLSYQNVWGTAKTEKPYLASIAHEIAVRTDSLRQTAITQVLAKNGINDVVALLEYESPGWNLKWIYTVFVVTRYSVYRIRIFDHGRDVAQLTIPETEMSEVSTCVDAVSSGYKGDQVSCGNDIGVVFMTIYKDRRPMAMFFQFRTTLGVKRRLVKSGTQQVQAFSRLCEILLVTPTGEAVSEATNLEYPCFGREHVK